MKRPLFDKHERHHIVNCLSGNYPNNTYLIHQYFVAKLKQEVFKKIIVPMCEPIIKFLSKYIS